MVLRSRFDSCCRVGFDDFQYKDPKFPSLSLIFGFKRNSYLQRAWDTTPPHHHQTTSPSLSNSNRALDFAVRCAPSTCAHAPRSALVAESLDDIRSSACDSISCARALFHLNLRAFSICTRAHLRLTVL